VEGNIVALMVDGSGFLCIEGSSVTFNRTTAINNLPFDWHSERFLVVNAGNGRIALYSPCHRRFLAAQNGLAEAGVYPIETLYDRPRCNETFRVVLYSNSTVRLYCGIDDNILLKMGKAHFLTLYKSMDLNRPSNEGEYIASCGSANDPFEVG
jgi:hypothetical protein